MQKLEGYSSKQFAFVRILMGGYLLLHFLFLIPYGKVLFSNEGILPQASLNFTYPIFPNILFLFDSPTFISSFLIALSLLSILLLIGWKRRIVSVLLWYGFACLFNRNNLINNPSLAFVGWILLAFACIPSGERFAVDKKNDDWIMPKELFWGAWLIMGVSYTISGLHKMGSPGWSNGLAMRYLMENPLARDYFLRDWLLLSPDWLIKIKTWSVLGLEVCFLPLIFFKQGRFIAWTLMVGMHLGILALVDFADLSIGVLMIHAFTFDPAWTMPTMPTFFMKRRENS